MYNKKWRKERNSRHFCLGDVISGEMKSYPARHRHSW
jgi:hypothetical protein